MTLDEIKTAIDEGRVSIVPGQSDEYVAVRIAPPETTGEKIAKDWIPTQTGVRNLARQINAAIAAEHKECEVVARTWRNWTKSASDSLVCDEIADRISARGRK